MAQEKEKLGHQNMSTTSIYAHTSSKHLKGAVDEAFSD